MNRLLPHWPMLCLAAFPLVTAAANPQTAPAGQRDAVPRLRTEMLVTTDWLAANLDKPGLVILHVSTSRRTYDAGHVPGAQFVGWQDITMTRDGLPAELPPLEKLVALVHRLGIDRDSRIVLYDDGDGVSAGRAYVTLDYLGLGEHSALLDGQWAQWKAEGRPVSQAEPEVKPSSFAPRVRPEILVDLRAMRDLVWAKNHFDGAGLALIDARSEAEFTGEQPGLGLKRTGHIPGSINIPWARNVVGPANPTLRPAGELREELAKAGVRPDDRVVVFCRTGARSSPTYFLLRYLGYDVQLYDGSFTEWSAAEDTPVEIGPAKPQAASEP